MNSETATASAEESKQYATNPEYQSTNFTVNVTDQDGVQAMVDFVVEKFGRLDYAVNAAGVSIYSHRQKYKFLLITRLINRLITAFIPHSPIPISRTLTASRLSMLAACFSAAAPKPPQCANRPHVASLAAPAHGISVAELS